MTSPLRYPVLQGVRSVSGLWLPSNRYSDAVLRETVFRCWQPGSLLVCFDRGHLLRWPHARQADCAGLPGWPLCQVGAALASAPLAPADLADHPVADLWLVSGHRLVALMLRDGKPVDPSLWMGLEDYALVETLDCQTRDTPPPLNTPAKPVHQILEGIGAPSPEREQFLNSLHKTRDQDSPSIRTMNGILYGFLGLLLAPLAALLTPSSPAGYPSRETLPPRSPAGNPPSALRSWFSRLLELTRISRLLDWQQANYLKRMLELFEQDDLHEALRHAIPLGGQAAAASLPLAGPLGPRQTLDLHNPVKASGQIELGDALNQHLQQLYRRTYERLVRDNRLDEAAYVLAELLQKRGEALDFLEQHERFEQAAELALAWDQPAPVILRLMCQAGDWNRALQVARRDNAYASAILMLEKQRPELAERLRIAWGEDLAARGDWLAAVDAIWPSATARPIAADWLQQAEGAGGALAARALVQRAVLLPDTLDLYQSRLAPLRTSEEEYESRLALAAALRTIPQNSPATAALASAILPGLLADSANNRPNIQRQTINELLIRCDDPLLRADIPWMEVDANGKKPGIPLATAASPVQLTAPAPGLLPVSDAVMLGDGRYLVAHGEAGVTVFDRRGRSQQHYDVPADTLVLADSLTVALALARRDGVYRVNRIDLVNRRLTDLGRIAINRHASTFDGIEWTVSSANRLMVIDTTRSLRDVVWQVADLPGPVVMLERWSNVERLLLSTPNGDEIWHYQLPSRRLTLRGKAPDGDSLIMLPDGGWGTVELQAGSDVASLELVPKGEQTWVIQGINTVPCQLALIVTRVLADPMMIAKLMLDIMPGETIRISLQGRGGWLIAGVGRGNAQVWHVFALRSRQAAQLCARIEWDSARKPGFSCTDVTVPGNLLFRDQQGRLLEIDALDCERQHHITLL